MNTKVVLITGALTGIGRATALAFAKAGARLIVSGRRDEAGAKLVTELRESGAEAEYVHADVRIEDDVQNLVGETIKRFGRIDVAVNNAGTEGKPGPLIDQTVESYTKTFDANVLGTFLGLKGQIPQLGRRVRAQPGPLYYRGAGTQRDGIT
jgi:NAD(P)-dependent dehydrogenase (short-subunit alcohol dehydrogenase family)